MHKNRQVSLDILREAIPFGVNLYEEHQRFVKSFDPKWRTDEQVMLLLSAIALFSPDAPNVVHRDVVKLEQVSSKTYTALSAVLVVEIS